LEQQVHNERLQLADWRRRVAEMYADWRAESGSNPAAATARLREARDAIFQSHPQSPIPVDQRARFGGLSYFEYDPKYRLRAVLEPEREPEATSGLAELGFGAPALMRLPSSGEESFSFSRIGRVRLSGPLDGQTLPVFWMAGYAGGLFIPFRDGTSGDETYAAGRYLWDSVKGADLGGDYSSGELVLDFNLAYHPSCAYDPKWSCPLASSESRIEPPIRVGERLRVPDQAV
jgi:uncharacterized protein (DUF1684 family)